jgi:hypothetical protein
MNEHAGIDPQVHECVEACQDCHNMCLSMALGYCLEAGGRHVEPEHFRLMIQCALTCSSTASFMVAGKARHDRVADVCAQICEACAASCEDLGDMQECVRACRRCAELCREIAMLSVEPA